MAGLIKKRSKKGSDHSQAIEQNNYAISLEIQPNSTPLAAEGPEKVLRIFEFFMRHVHFSPGFRDELVQLFQGPSDLLQHPGLNSSLNAMSNLRFCSSCQQEEFEVVTECNHPFCQQCYYSSVYKATNGLVCLNEQEMPKYRPLCPACAEPLSLSDLAKSDPKSWSEWQEKAALRLQSSPVQSSCTICNRSVAYDDLDQCRHKCSDCLYAAVRSGHVACSACKSGYNWLDTLRALKIQCGGCGRSVHVVSDYTFAVCEGHRLCFACVRDSCNKQQCVVCSTKLDAQVLSAIEKALFRQCEQCESSVESFYFLPKDCCNRQICSICQYEDNSFKCRSCSAPLEAPAKEFLAELAKDLEELSKSEPALFTNPL